MLNLFADISLWWTFFVAAVAIPPFLFYARGVISDVVEVEGTIRKRLSTAADIVGTKRVVMGHTHRALHGFVDDVEYLNTGTWSAAYTDLECTIPSGSKCFARIQPTQDGPRESVLLEWLDPDVSVLPRLAPGEAFPQRNARSPGRKAGKPAA